MSRAPRPPVLDRSRRGAEPAEPPQPLVPVPTLPPSFATRPYSAMGPQPGHPPVPPPKQRRSLVGPLLVLLLLVGAGAGAAVYTFVLRQPADEAEQLTTQPFADGSGASASAGGDVRLPALPILQFERPVIGTATWTTTGTDLRHDGAGAISEVTTELEIAGDFGRRIARVHISGTAASGPSTVVYTEGLEYRPGTAFGAPWTRAEHQFVAPAQPYYEPSSVEMYGDVVAPQSASLGRDVSRSTEVVDGRTLTTYTFTVDARNVANVPADVLSTDAVSPGLYDGTMEITIDDAGLVWRLQFTGKEDELRAALAGTSIGTTMRSTFSRELVALDAPVDAQIPPEFAADAPAQEPTRPRATLPGQTEACLMDGTTLEAAALAWMAMTGSATPPTEAQLVPDYLMAESEFHDLVDGIPVAVVGGRCG